jgi:O-antigen ligase
MNEEKNKLFDILRGLILVLLLAATPLFITRFTFDSFYTPKIVWIEFWTAALICIYLAGFISGKPFRIMFFPVIGLLGLYVLLNLVSGFFAESRSLWWDQCSFLLFLFILSLFFIDYLYGSRRRVFILLWGISISCAIMASWAVFEDFAAKFFPNALSTVPRLNDWRGFISAGLGNTGYVADFIAVLFPMNFLLYLHARGKTHEIFLLFNLLISYAALIICWSVQSNAGLIICFPVLFYFLIKYKSRWFWMKKRLRITVLLAGFILITIFYISPVPVNPHNPSIFKQAFSSDRWEYGGESRLVIWSQSLEIIKKNPWMGIGSGNFSYQYVSQASPWLNTPKRLKYIGQYTNAAHNEILQSWGELGIAGPVVLLFLLVLLIRALLWPIEDTSEANRWIRVGALCAIICAVFPAMMAYPLRLPVSMMLFIFICIIPVVIIPRTRAFNDTMIIPVEFSWYSFHVSVLLENMHKPIGSVIHLELKENFARILSIIILLSFSLWGFHIIKPLISDKYFQDGKILHEYIKSGRGNRVIHEKFEESMKKSLFWWPEHHDCRSTYAQYLCHHGRFKEAIPELQKTLERLQASELYEALGVSYEARGMKKEAITAYEVFFKRSPVLKHFKTKFYKHYLQLKNEPDK